MTLKNKILDLRAKGYTYNQIIEELNCSKGTISYYCGLNQKEKTKKRRQKNRKKNHPYKRKLEFFLSIINNEPKLCYNSNNKKLIKAKIEGFCKMNKKYAKPTFTVDDVIEKFGENPKCYLTGQTIDISQPKTYHFDHILPRSRGGENTLENLGICTKQANMAKSNMTYDEFIKFCNKVVSYNKKKSEVDGN